MTTIQNYCLENKYTLINEIIDEKIHKNNKCIAQLNLTCNHIKEIKLSTLSTNSKINCLVCKNIEKYNYNLDTKLKICDKCNYTYPNTPYSNLKKWKCCICHNPEKSESIFFKFLHDKNLEPTKNFIYPDSSMTGDIYIMSKDNMILFEIDDNSHTKKSNKESHIFKDTLVLAKNHKIKLFRFHKAIIDDVMENFDKLLEIIDNEKYPAVINYIGINSILHKKQLKFYNKFIQEGVKIIDNLDIIEVIPETEIDKTETLAKEIPILENSTDSEPTIILE